MRGLILALVQGDRFVWLGFASIWTVAAATALLHASRTGRSPGTLRTIVIAAVATIAAAAALPAVRALAVPRLRWRDVEAPDLIAPTGETWRKLRGPLAALVIDGAPEIAIPTIDARDRWVLFGLLSGKPIAGLEPAPPSTPEIGGARLCRSDNKACRAWPQAWPDPQKAPSLPEITWSRDDTSHALAFDGDTKMFLNAIEGEPSELALEVVGRVNAEAPREASSALFVVRGIGGGALRSVRVVASPGPRTKGDDAGPVHAFRLQREDARLGVATSIARWVALPLLVVLGLALPFALVLLLLAPSLFARRLARRGATRRDGDQPSALVPVTGAGRFTTAADDIDLGERKVLRGARVATVHPLASGEPVVSRSWFFVVSTDDAIELAPADDDPFRRAAAAWMSARIAPLGVLAVGLALAAPAVVALAALAAAR